MLAAAAQPEMAMVHQEVDAVVFRVIGYGSDSGTRWRILCAFRHRFEAAVGPRLGSDFAAHHEGRFLRQVF